MQKIIKYKTDYLANFNKQISLHEYAYIFNRDMFIRLHDQYQMSLHVGKMVFHYLTSIEFYKDFCHYIWSDLYKEGYWMLENCGLAVY